MRLPDETVITSADVVPKHPKIMTLPLIRKTEQEELWRKYQQVCGRGVVIDIS